MSSDSSHPSISRAFHCVSVKHVRMEMSSIMSMSFEIQDIHQMSMFTVSCVVEVYISVNIKMVNKRSGDVK